jgi:hypothetical protein
MATMAGLGARTRKDGVSLLHPGARRLGVPCAPRPRGQGMGGGTAEYGEIWAAACNGVRANGAEALPLSTAWGLCAWQLGRGPGGSVRRQWVPSHVDRRALAGLGVWARGNRGGASVRVRDGARDVTRVGAVGSI